MMFFSRLTVLELIYKDDGVTELEWIGTFTMTVYYIIACFKIFHTEILMNNFII